MPNRWTAETIRILSQGDGPIPGCRDEFQMEPGTRLMRGSCPACGWRTESVESRRFEELRALTAAHGRAGQQALTELIQQDLSYVDYAELVGILGWANRPHAAPDAVRSAPMPESAFDRFREFSAVVGTEEVALDWGEPLTNADANWPSQGSTCAHICGSAPDHRCDARATTRLAYRLPSGGTRSMPICGPCHESETGAPAVALNQFGADIEHLRTAPGVPESEIQRIQERIQAGILALAEPPETDTDA